MPGRFQVAGCAIIKKDGKVLITRRSKSRWNGGRWEFVSGRIEQGEDVITGTKREVKEEVGLNVQITDILKTSHFYRGIKVCPENEVIMVTYVADYLSGEVVLNEDEQDAYEWVFLHEIDFSKYVGLQEEFDQEIQAYFKYLQSKKV